MSVPLRHRPIVPGWPRARAILLSGVFGFAVWSAFVATAGGRACTPRFVWSEAFLWWAIYSTMGFVYAIPVTAIIGAIAYCVAARSSWANKKLLLAVFGIGLIGVAIGLGMRMPANGQCVYP